MLTKNQIRDIKSLADKKNRIASGLFIAEGKKLIGELLESEIEIETIFTTKENISQFQSKNPENSRICIEVSEDEIKKISQLITPQGCIALCKIPEYIFSEQPVYNDFIFCLDGIQDPGNLGTIIRLSDWFGLKEIICSPETTDIYNPKVVQATMGAISRVRVHYLTIKRYLEKQKESQVQILGTFMDGENLYESNLPTSGIIILGNEGKGISHDLVPMINRRITIPDFHSDHKKPDSLNVSVAASIIISEFKRRSLSNKN
jgi:RNA methyltransferase, TrmH family